MGAHPVGANIGAAGAGSWTPGLTAQAQAINSQIMGTDWGSMLAAGIADMNAAYGGDIGSLGALSGGMANVGSGWGLGGDADGLGGSYGAGGFAGGDAGYGSDARSGRDGADQRND